MRFYSVVLALLAAFSARALEPVDGVWQLATAQDVVDFAAVINDGEAQTDVNVVLTADIDLTEQPTLMIGNDPAKPFSGTFDGQGHTVKLAINVENTGNYSGTLFRFAENATFKNLYLTGSVTTCGKHAASLLSVAAGTVVLEKVFSDCDIYTNANDACMGGLVGMTGENGAEGFAADVTFKHCAFVGTITHTGEDIGQNHGGNFVGWKGNRNAVITLKGCFVAPKSVTNSANFCTFVRYWNGNDNGRISLENCFYVNDITDYAAFQGTAASAEQFASGELCYAMNEKLTSGQAWFQSLGEDNFPVLDPSHKTVYANGTLHCDGTPDAIEYSNTYSDSPVIPPHTFKDGICQVCGQTDANFAEKDEEGFYLIGSPAQMVWFAATVNSGSTAVNARLTSDIDMGSVEDFAMIGTREHPYVGTFDGQDHLIANLKLEKAQDFVGFFSTVAGGANISHLILDMTCSIFSTGNRVGMVGASYGTGDVYITCCGNEGNVESTSPFESTAAGIFGCNVDCYSDVHIDRCYSTGVITGMNQSAQIAGWLNYKGNSSMTNCWSTAEVTGYDNLGSVMARHSGQRLTNNFSTMGQCEMFENAEVGSGRLCYRLNGSRPSAAPVWYQTVGEDERPTWNEGHGIVFQKGEDEYDSMKDDDDFSFKRAEMIDFESLFTEELVATKSLAEGYQDYLLEMGEMDFTTLLAAYDSLATLKNGLNESAGAYAAYVAKVDEVKAFLAESTELTGTYLDLLKAYLEGDEDPGTYPNGTYLYIMDNLLLTTDEIRAETEYVEVLRRQAVEGGYVKDSDITNLLVNAEFANFYEGWETEFHGCGRNSDVYEGRHISETWNGAFNIHQTVTGLKPGIYEMQIQASYRPGFQPTSTNLSGMLYMNDQNVYIISSYEDMVLADDAIDGENCYLNMEDFLHDMIIGDPENPEGYVPRGTKGAYYAYKAGRYQNRLACLVTEDGTLTLGIKDDGSGAPEDETSWAEMKLIYRGTVEEAAESLDAALQYMAARAQTLLDYQCDVDFSLYPNFGNELRDGLKHALDAIPASTTGEQKYAVVNTLSELFRQIYASKRAYTAYNAACEQYVDKISTLAQNGFDFGDTTSDACIALAYDIQDKIYSGGYTQEEALEQAELKALPFYATIFGVTPELAGDVYQIADYANMVWLRNQIIAGNTGLSVALTQDIDLSSFPDFMLSEEKSQSFSGTLDGQGHTITLAINIERAGDFSGALFRYAQNATFRNLRLTGSVTTTGKHAASLVSCLYGTGASTLTNVISDCDVFTNAGDACMGGLVGHAGDVWNGGVGADITFTNCAFTGNITHTGDVNQNHGGSFIGWKGCNDVKVTINNSYAAPKSISHSASFCTFVRFLNGMDNGEIHPINSYYQSDITDYAFKQGEEKSADQFASGEVCYALNGDQSSIAWYQTIGEDAYPVLDPTHKSVVKNDDGTFGNATAIETIRTDADAASIVVYNLQGQRVEKAVKGLYIVGGKKVLVK